MRFFRLFPCLCLLALLSGCLSEPPSRGSIRPTTEQAPSTSEQQAPTAPKPEAKSIIPDINAEGRRGEIARMMMRKSTRQFLRADINQDYQISHEEADEHLPFISKEFGRYDHDNNGSVSWQEFLGHDEWPRPSHQSTK